MRTGLLGDEGFVERLAQASVIVFGVGGVGSWCVEALARTAIGHITMVDSDTIAPSNINRQLPALQSTIGRPKVEVMAERIADINPACHVSALQARYTPATASSFNIETYDYCVDAIDSLADKTDLILRCTAAPTAPRRAFFSSMGAARKADISRVATAEFWKVTGCPLARALRTDFRRKGVYPQRKFRCVYSPERIAQRDDAPAGVNGTLVHATAVFGLSLASMIIDDILKQSQP